MLSRNIMYIQKVLLITLLIVILVPNGYEAMASKAFHSCRVVMEFDLSDHGPGKEARLWIPYPSSGRYQLVTDIKVSGSFDRSGVYTDRKYGVQMLYAYWSPGHRVRRLVFSFNVTRWERIDRPFPNRMPCWDRSAYADYLEPPVHDASAGCIRELALSITDGKKDVLGKARAIYDWICENMRRDPGVRGCGQGNVCLLLGSRRGKCADIHSVFVALCRAAGIPAREVFGLRLGRNGINNITTWQHCWAEFYLPGHGWVVADPADVLKAMLAGHLDPGSPAIKDIKAYFWGAVDPYRVRLSRGRNVILNPPQQGPPLNYFMYPFAQVGGKSLDWLEPGTFRYKITSYPLVEDTGRN